MSSLAEDIRRLAELDWAEQVQERVQERVQANLAVVQAYQDEVDDLLARGRALHWWQIVARQKLIRRARAILLSNRITLAENRRLPSRINDVLFQRRAAPHYMTLEDL